MRWILLINTKLSHPLCLNRKKITYKMMRYNWLSYISSSYRRDYGKLRIWRSCKTRHYEGSGRWRMNSHPLGCDSSKCKYIRMVKFPFVQTLRILIYWEIWKRVRFNILNHRRWIIFWWFILIIFIFYRMSKLIVRVI